MFEFSLLLTLAWGALAFGAEYAWAYTPLLVMCVTTGILGLRRTCGAMPPRMLLVALVLILLAAAAQALLPASAVPGQGPSKDVDFARLYAVVTMQPPPESGVAPRLSIAPDRTYLGMAFVATLGLFMIGCTRGISATGAKRLTQGIVLLGVVVAFVGIIQSAVRTENLYGFWQRPKQGVGFAPFINENHFAGWMAMVLSLAIGSFAGDVGSALRHVQPTWRKRILWFSSPRASRMIMTAGGISIMAISMVTTRSRAGLVGLAAVCLLGSLWMLRRQAGHRRFIAAVTVASLFAFALAWGGAGKTIDEFSHAPQDLGGRRQIWTDTWQMVQDYPFTGTGLNTFGIAMLYYQTTPVSLGVAVEAHNDYLQILAEGGLLLAVPILLALTLFVREVWRRYKDKADEPDTYWVRTGAVAGLLAIAGMEIVDFTLQMPGATAMFAALAAIAMHRPNRQGGPRP